MWKRNERILQDSINSANKLLIEQFVRLLNICERCKCLFVIIGNTSIVIHVIVKLTQMTLISGFHVSLTENLYRLVIWDY